MMIIVIIAGGSGTRLWPLSTPDYPKHLLRIDGGEDSLLQSTYKRAKQLAKKVYVVTENGHVHHVKDQLPDLADDYFITEPARRGTASCIVAALSHIGKSNDADEPIAFMHADHYIRDNDGFTHSLKIAASTAEKTKRIVLIGIEPDYPATGFGYIQKGDIFDEQNFVFDVHSFKEKPDHKTAFEYLKSGHYLWNGGYFVASLNTFLKVMKEVAPTLLKNYEELTTASEASYKDTYLAFENIAIDYALIEKVPNLLVVPAEFDWMDVGSFADLHNAVESDEQGNSISGNIQLEGVQNSIIQNHENKPIAIIGLENVAVINTKDGLVVTRKDISQKVGEVSKRLLNGN
jgi:mannose-1-phosphate guanylyltransferase/mannose-6-phosphate isomerase